jgi:hypothetical protein
MNEGAIVLPLSIQNNILANPGGERAIWHRSVLATQLENFSGLKPAVILLA